MIGSNSSPNEGWHQLEQTSTVPTRGEFRVFDTTLSVADGAVLLALDASGFRHVLVPVAPEFPAAHDRRSGGVHLATRSLVDDSGQRQYLDLACQKEHLNSVFTHLADEVLELLGQNPNQPLQACRQTLQRWRELLDRDVENVLSTEALCGLFGELWHLARIASQNPRGLSTWQGPQGARHDFTTEGWALEVKTTARRDEWKFRVHGLTQLEQPRDSRLFLCAMRLEINGAAGATIPDAIHGILESGVDRRDLLTRLAQLGYDVRDEPHYRQLRFEVTDFRTYEVGTLFPRLTDTSFDPTGLPSGILDIHYTIDLADSQTVPLKSETLDRLHAALAGVPNDGTIGSAI
jgi:hypothetical protein